MYTATIKLTEVQLQLVRDVIKPSPWYKDSSSCKLTKKKTADGTLEFQFVPRTRKTRATISAAKVWLNAYEESDQGRLIDITYAAQKLGWSLQTCEALRGKLHRAVRKETNRLKEAA